jgi:hypothetical protein
MGYEARDEECGITIAILRDVISLVSRNRLGRKPGDFVAARGKFGNRVKESD